jgi:hypothetical protein
VKLTIQQAQAVVAAATAAATETKVPMNIAVLDAAMARPIRAQRPSRPDSRAARSRSAPSGLVRDIVAMSAGANSGVLYRVTEELPYAWQSGLEMQLLDDVRHPDGKNPLTSCGALYGVLAPHPRLLAAVPSTFHCGRIVVSGSQVSTGSIINVL